MKGHFSGNSPMIEVKIAEKTVTLLLDTGFNGQIMLPEGLIEQLQLDKVGVSEFITADGVAKETSVYRAKILFLGDIIEVIVISTASHFSLLGMQLLGDCRIVIDRSNDIVEIAKD
tara:strand:- start:1218 stop:1565 length:348 start_codon:yes stop_codon:yes gene_type:complete